MRLDLLRLLAGAGTILALAHCSLAPIPASTTASTSGSGGSSSSTSSSSSSSTSSSGTGGSMVPPPPEAMPGCNPVIGDDCLTPFPSTFFETADPTTSTGVRISISPSIIPPLANGTTLSVARYNQKDGFSPATPFVVYFKGGVDTSKLPTLDTLDQTVHATSPVQVVDYETGARVPVFAEMDVEGDASLPHAFLVHPMQRLAPEHRYVIALVGLTDPSGKPIAPAPFVALRDQTTLSKSLEPVAARYEEIFASLEKAGVPRGSLSLAWDVITASDATATGHLVPMRDNALSMVGSGALTYTVTSSTDTPSDPNILREVVITAKTPSYLLDSSGHSMMNFGPDGQPAVRGLDDMPIIVKIPQCATKATGPLPLIVFGHGLFGTAEATLATPLLQQVQNQACVVFIGTDWIGLAQPDLPMLAQYLPMDLNNVYLVTDRLQQAHVNIQVMTRLFLTTLKNDPALAVNGKAVTDGSNVTYFGISDGGIQGATFMALTPDIERGALNVPGSEWSLMLYRSVDFAPIKPILEAAIPSPVTAQILIGLMQSEWDYTDPITFAPHLLHDPLPGSFTKRILVQESIGDAQVPNIATRTLGRTMGLPGLDLITPLYGIDAQPAPLDSAYTQWDAHKMPRPPLTDTALSSDNGAHDAVYQYGPAQQQLLTFLGGGGILQTCTGPCNF